MRKALVGLAVSGLSIIGTAPLVLAQDTSQQQAQAEVDNDDDGGKWGLLGLVGLAGLAGLAGLKRRDRYDNRGISTTTTPPR